MMAFGCFNIDQHPHFEGAGAVYVVALTPKKAVWAAGAVFCGFRDGQTDRPGVGRSAYNCVRSCPERQFDGVAVMHAQSGRPSLTILTRTTGGRIVPASAPQVRAVTAKSVTGIGVLSVKRRPNRAKAPFARFSYGRARGRALRPATPFGGNANPARPATRDWRLRWLVNPVQTEVVMPDHGHGRNLPKTIKFQDTELAIIDRDGVPWLTGPDIARAIGYSRSDEIGRIYRRRKDEFSEAMSCTANLAVHGKASPTRVRVFSPRGAQLIAMFANTTTAKAFLSLIRI